MATQRHPVLTACPPKARKSSALCVCAHPHDVQRSGTAEGHRWLARGLKVTQGSFALDLGHSKFRIITKVHQSISLAEDSMESAASFQNVQA